MATPEQITQTVNRYLEYAGKGAVDDIADLYAYGRHRRGSRRRRSPHRAASHSRLLLRDARGRAVRTEVVTLRALGHEAAFFWTLTMKMGDGGIRIEIISVMTFDDEAKITSMKAYWTPENITQL